MKRTAATATGLLMIFALLLALPLSLNAQSQIVKQRAKEVREKVESRNAPAKPMTATNATTRAQQPAKPSPPKLAQPTKPALTSNTATKAPTPAKRTVATTPTARVQRPAKPNPPKQPQPVKADPAKKPETPQRRCGIRDSRARAIGTSCARA